MRTIKCPNCGLAMQFKPQAGAVRIQCPQCKTLLQVAGQAGDSPATPTPRSAAANPAKTRPTQAKSAGPTSKPLRSNETSRPNETSTPKETSGAKKTVPTKQAPTKQAPTKQSPTKQTPRVASPSDPLAASPGGVFDLGSLDLPGPDVHVGGAFASAPLDPLAIPRSPLATPRAPGVPAGFSKPLSSVPRTAAAVAKPKSPGTSGTNQSNKPTLIWVGAGAAGLLLLLTVGGLAFYLMGASDDVTAEQSDSAVMVATSIDVPVPEKEVASVRPSIEVASPPPSASVSVSSPVANFPVAKSVGDFADAGEFTTQKLGSVSASFPSGTLLQSLPTGIQERAVRSEATKATLYVAVANVGAELIDQDKIIRQLQRLVMADVRLGEPCQRSGRQGFQGRLSGSLIVPSMEVEVYLGGGKAVVIGWATPQHEVDLFTPLILQNLKPPVESDPKLVETEKQKFWDSIQF